MTNIPKGYRQNAQGHLVPEDAIPEIDIDRDALVDEIFKAAEQLQVSMAQFKEKSMGDIEAFIELVAEKYDTEIGGAKGNITLLSFDGSKKVQIAVGDTIHFDERLTVAKALVDECIHEWTEGSRSEIKALVEHAFQTDKEGKINTGRILELTRLAIDHPKWKKAMEAIRDSIQVVSSKSYIRLYTRPEKIKKYQQLALDIASL